MRCQYCGERLRPLGLALDQDFCSPTHRELYHERVRRVLSQLSEAEASSYDHVEGEESSPQNLEASNPSTQLCSASNTRDSATDPPPWTPRSIGVSVEAYLLESEVEVGTPPVSFPMIDFLVEGPSQGLGCPQVIWHPSPVVEQIPKPELSYCPTFESGLPMLAPAVGIGFPAAHAEVFNFVRDTDDCCIPMTFDLTYPELLARHRALLSFSTAPTNMDPLEAAKPAERTFCDTSRVSWLPMAAEAVLTFVSARIRDAAISAISIPAMQSLCAKTLPAGSHFSPTTLYPVFRNNARIRGWRLRITFTERPVWQQGSVASPKANG